jgi:hypothetical protein
MLYFLPHSHLLEGEERNIKVLVSFEFHSLPAMVSETKIKFYDPKDRRDRSLGCPMSWMARSEICHRNLIISRTLGGGPRDGSLRRQGHVFQWSTSCSSFRRIRSVQSFFTFILTTAPSSHRQICKKGLLPPDIYHAALLWSLVTPARHSILSQSSSPFDSHDDHAYELVTRPRCSLACHEPRALATCM